METGGFQEPLTCPTGLWQALQVPGDPNDTGEQPWGGSFGSQAWESGPDLLFANGIPGGDFRLHGLVCPHPKPQTHERSPSPMLAWLSSELKLRACPLKHPRSPDSDLLWPLLSDLWNQDVDMAPSGSVVLSRWSPVWWVGGMWKPSPSPALLPHQP